LKLGATYDVGMGILDDARKEEDELKAAGQELREKIIEEIKRKRVARDGVSEEQLRSREEQDRLSEEKGRQLSEEFLDEVRTRHIEPHGTVYVVTTKRERVRHSGSKSWGWLQEEVISREEAGRCFTIVHHHFDPTTAGEFVVEHHIDPTTGQELVAEKELVETLPAIKRWIGRDRPETKIYRTSYVQRPLEYHDGLATAMLNFLNQAR
jgi:hypothetical protein